MLSKCAGPDGKATRKRFTLDFKLKLLKRIDSGERQVDVANALGITGSTVRTVIKNRDSILEAGKSSVPTQATQLTKARPPIMVEMEKLLSIFVEDNTQRRIPLSADIIKQKALSLYEDLKKSFSEEVPFQASNGWFNNFRTRANLHSVSTKGEAASADAIGAHNFKAELKKKIEDGSYTEHQVINIDETGLFWKRLPRKTFISKEEKSAPGFKVSKDRLTLLLGGNAAGDFKLKPLLVYQSENPRALKNVVKSQLPVVWKANKKAWVTQALFLDWYSNHFGPDVEKYLGEKNLSRKALLIMDNAPGHPSKETLEKLVGFVEVVYMPPNTTSLIQPMDQGVISTFKSYYIRNVLAEAVRVTNGEDAPSLRDFWKAFNIKDAVNYISCAWQELKQKTMNGVWRKIWEDCVHDFRGFEETREIGEQVVALGNKVGLDLAIDDMEEIIADNAEGLTNEELIAVAEHQEHAYNEDQDNDMQAKPLPTLTSKVLSEAFQFFEQGFEVLRQNDPNTERSATVIRSLENSLSCYKLLYNEGKRAAKQSSIDSFFSKKQKVDSDDCIAGPSHMQD